MQLLVPSGVSLSELSGCLLRLVPRQNDVRPVETQGEQCGAAPNAVRCVWALSAGRSQRRASRTWPPGPGTFPGWVRDLLRVRLRRVLRSPLCLASSHTCHRVIHQPQPEYVSSSREKRVTNLGVAHPLPFCGGDRWPCSSVQGWSPVPGRGRAPAQTSQCAGAVIPWALRHE